MYLKVKLEIKAQKAEAMEKSIIIIGAGLAGLSAGCYAQMNGYKTQIFELYNIPPRGALYQLEMHEVQP